MYKNLRKYREQAGYSQSDMAQILGISRPFYNQLESGARRMSLPDARRIALVIGKRLGWPESLSWMDELFFAPDVAKRDKAGDERG